MSDATRLLLVDDDEDVRWTLAANLQLDGFTVIEADSGERALELVASEPFDLVFSDVRMRGMNGVDMFLHIKKQASGLPVVLTTAFSSEELVRSALMAGVFTVLPKPCDVAHTVRTLRRAASKPSVMVVDEVAERAKSLASLVSDLGVRAHAATDLGHAEAVLRAGGVDVIVTRLDESRDLASLRAASPAASLVAVNAARLDDCYPVVRAIAYARGEQAR